MSNPQAGTQNFSNHVNIPTTWMIIQVIYFIAAVLGIIAFFSTNSMTYLLAALLLICLGNLFALIIVRSYSTKLQDRIIRLEMRIRLEKVLPQELHEFIPQLTIPQLVALRFASDDEMTQLVNKVKNENITNQKDIKKLVTDWQGDYFRV